MAQFGEISSQMEVIEQLEQGVVFFATFLKVLLEAVSIGCVLLGLLTSGRLTVSLLTHPSTYHYARVRARFGRSLALALEFQLAADILATAVAPTFAALGRLGALAVIRTGLNYFLTKELEDLYELEKAAAPQATNGPE